MKQDKLLEFIENCSPKELELRLEECFKLLNKVCLCQDDKIPELKYEIAGYIGHHLHGTQ